MGRGWTQPGGGRGVEGRGQRGTAVPGTPAAGAWRAARGVEVTQPGRGHRGCRGHQLGGRTPPPAPRTGTNPAVAGPWPGNSPVSRACPSPPRPVRPPREAAVPAAGKGHLCPGTAVRWGAGPWGRPS
uniref:Uncharacterized protein n=1 Tax=Pipistrellus kuhlii TaxID=59472 RepID=A0A7J7RVJ7_PIPKU|nr:hypothetical protein mPipKuh1_010235 [Pipistrellus kuhlii]